MFKVESHVRGGEGVNEGVKEVSYGVGGKLVDEVTKTVVVEEVEND